ncbi:MAG TPA: cation transporter [Acholeplasmataceae bacterium]|nr:cation transporter [Acholeplasmataceae bacterium]
MAHHDHNHSHATKNISVAFFLNIFFTIIEMIGGFLTNSYAIISDALHDLGDSFSLGISWFLEKVSKKKPDRRYTFGYKRFSLLGALINSIILLFGSLFIIINAIPRFFNPEDVNTEGMIAFAILGILFNGLAVLLLHKEKSLNAKAITLHLLEDVLGWVAVLVISIFLLFIYIPILDTILSVLIAIYILYHVIKNLIAIFVVFLQAVPKHLSIDEIETEVKKFPLVTSIHHIHIWTLDGEKNFLSAHVTVKDNATSDDIIELKRKIKDLICLKDVCHSTIEIEYEKEICLDEKCQDENHLSS